MGRTAQPAALRIINGRGHGRDGRHRDSGGRAIEPPPPFRRLAPKKPDLSEAAAAHWEEIVPELERLELLTPAHIGGLVMMCEAWAMHIWAIEKLRKEGYVVKSSAGQTRHPAVLVATSSWKEYRAWAIQFGLSPSAEGRLKPKEAGGGEENPFQ